jgi:hypothetical protein
LHLYHLPTYTSLIHLVVSPPPPPISNFLITLLLALSKTKAVGNLVEDVNVVESTTESLLARTKSIDRDISERVNTLGIIGANSTVDEETLGRVLGVGVVVVVLELDGSLPGTGLLDLVVLTMVGDGSDTSGDGVSRLPVGREVGASAVVDALGLLGVLRLTRLSVGADSTALVTVILLLGEVLSVGRTVNAATVSYLM